MNILILDTETTDLERARLVQLAYKNLTTGTLVNEYFKPPVPISFGSMAVHHITNDMVREKPAFQESAHFGQLDNFLKDGVVVAHNAPFDVGVLANEGLQVPRHIDTLRVARHVLSSPQYSLQYLRYSLGLRVGEVVAHDALGDITVLEALFAHLKKSVAEKFGVADDAENIKKMIALTQTPVLLTTLAFGKYRGKTYEEVARTDRGYLEWLFNSESQKKVEEQNEDLVHVLKHWLHGPQIEELPF